MSAHGHVASPNLPTEVHHLEDMYPDCLWTGYFSSGIRSPGIAGPDGTRIPFWLPFYTEEYCKIRGWRHHTQADLAAQLIDSLPLEATIPVVVVGDTAFEAKQIRRSCAKRNYHWIVPLNPERRLAGSKPRPKVLSLCQSLKESDLSEVSFRLDQGESSPMARVSPGRSQSSKHRRVYWAHKRIADVLSVGEVVLLLSLIHIS